MLLLQQMLVLFIYISIGYVSCKKGILDKRTSEKLSWMVVHVANPALPISSVVNGEGSIQGRDLLLTVGLAAAVFASLILLAQMAPLVFRVAKEERGVYKMMTLFNNIGFMGFPLISAVYGDEALLYAAVFLVLFSILIYTYGIQILCGSGGGIQWKKILNPGVMTSLLALLLCQVQLSMPQFVKSALSGLSGLTAPLGMIVIGISLAAIRPKELFLNRRLFVYSLVKLLVVPIGGMLIIRSFVDNEMLCGVCMIMLATPAASMTAMMAQQYKNNYELAAKGVALTTLLSVVTIPIVSSVVF